MMDFNRLIKSEAEVMLRLHNKVHETFEKRNKDRKTWENACEEFHTYESVIDPFIDKVYEAKDLNDDHELLEFTIAFLEIDPIFFRSGYIKEEMLRKLKRTDFTKIQRNRLIDVLIDAVRKRKSREYKGYCRLASIISNEYLINNISDLITSKDSSRKSRAKLMKEYIDKSESLEKL